MNGIKQKSMAKLCFALSLFILAGVFRQIDYEIPPLPAAVCFMLTNLIYIGLAMAWGFSISSRILHRNVRRYLLLGCAMAVMWMFLQISLFSNRSRYNASPVVSVLCAADSCAAVQPVRSAGAWTAGWRRHFRPVAFAIYSRGAADLWRSDQRSASDGV